MFCGPGTKGLFEKCIDCIERDMLLEKGIYACQSFCKVYAAAKEVQDQVAAARTFNSSMGQLQTAGYGRATNNQYEKWKKVGESRW